MQVVRIRQNGNSLAMTIPRPYAQQLHWGLGENLVLEIVDNRLEVRALRNHLPPITRPTWDAQRVTNGSAQS
jgi:antitoxin component of MazEF toxin-antitoxin module